MALCFLTTLSTTQWKRMKKNKFKRSRRKKDRVCRQGRGKLRGKVMETLRWRRNGKGEQGTGLTYILTYMRWEGLQGGDTLLRVGRFPFREIGLQARAGLIHWHGPTGQSGLPAFQGRGTGRVWVVWTAGDLIDIGWDLPPERGVLALQRLQLEETVSNTLRGALSKASVVPCPDPFCVYSTSRQFFSHCSSRYEYIYIYPGNRELSQLKFNIWIQPSQRKQFLTCHHQFTKPEAASVIINARFFQRNIWNH